MRGVLDGQVKLFAAMLRQEKVIFGQLKALLRTVDLQGAVVAADALCRQWTAPLGTRARPREPSSWTTST